VYLLNSFSLSHSYAYIHTYTSGTRCREGGDEGEHAVCQRPGTGTCHLKTLGRCHNGDVDCSSVYTLSRSIVPQEPLSRFYGLELSDNDRSWTLKVEDGVMNNLEGRVNSWELDLVLEPCRGGEDEFTWTQVLNSSSSNEDANVPPPRYDHSAVVVGNSMFLFGGFSDVVRNDLWRFDVFETRSSNSLDSTGSLVSGSWTELMYPTASTTGGDNYYKYTPPRRYGRVSLVTPWGILSVGGLKEPNTDNNDPRYANTLTIHNPILRTSIFVSALSIFVSATPAHVSPYSNTCFSAAPTHTHQHNTIFRNLETHSNLGTT